MRLRLVVLTSLIFQAYAQAVNETYTKDLISGLNGANLTALATALESIEGTSQGTALFAALPGVPKTLFAPVNEAFARLSEDVSRNTTLLADTLSYHVLQGEIDPLKIIRAPEHGFYSTLYATQVFSTNRSQITIVSLVNGTDAKERIAFPYQNGGTAYAHIEPVDVANLRVYPVDSVLALPPSAEQAARTYAPAFAAALGQAGPMEPLSSRPVTMMFAPEDAAWTDAADWLKTLSASQLNAVHSNHLVNGSDMYTSIFRGKVLSDAGQVLEMSRNASGYFVSSGMTTARVVRPDVLLANGVVHVIDRVLRNTEVAVNVTSSAVGRKRLSVGTAATSWAVGIIVGMALI